MRYKVALIGAAIAAAIAPLPSPAVERFYSSTIFPWLQAALTGLSNQLSIAFLDALLVLAAIWLAGLTVGAFLLRHRLGWFAAAGRWIVNVSASAAAVYLAFLLMWGLNYRRVPLVDKLPYDRSRVTPEAAHALALRAVDQVNGLYASAHAMLARPVALDPSLATGFADAQHRLGTKRLARPARPKHSILDLYFKSAGVDGMTDPFFLETLVVDDLLPFERPHVIAHEWSHLAGFADEGEANFVGWLACMHASDAAKYSGWMFLYGEAAASLRPDERADVAGRLANGPRDDLRAVADRIRRHLRPVVADAGWRVYDRYLKANRVDAGVRSYAEVVRLVLGVRLDTE